MRWFYVLVPLCFGYTKTTWFYYSILVRKKQECYNRAMNILYCGDAGIARGVLVSILSLLKYNKGELHIYIMTIRYEGVEPFANKTAEFLDRLVKKTNAKNFVKLVDATEVFVQNLPRKNMGTYFTPCAMLRLYMDKVTELAGLERVLYLDYDVVCRGDISEFYETDLTGIEVAGVLDIYGRRWYHYRGLLKWRKDEGVIDMRPDDERYEWILKQDYMNSGVMLFNLEECRKTGVLEKAVQICASRKMLLPDQAALNKAIPRRKLMSRKYNEQGERSQKDTILHHFSNNFKFWPYFKVQKVKPFEIAKVHEVLKIHEYDDILREYKKLEAGL